jgi:hypothetical protein
VGRRPHPGHDILFFEAEEMKNMRRTVFFSSALFLVSFAVTAQTRQLEGTHPGWPLAQNSEKPWTRWWWPGSAVDRQGLIAQLQQFAAAGLGGVEITPIYGAKGYEARYLDFLSPRFMEMLEQTGREARRLGLGVDMVTGTGWPFGGSWVRFEDGSMRAVLNEGRLTGVPTNMMVKRAAPGGEGRVLSPYSAEALRRYLAHFDRAFDGFPRGLIRGQFHDSFEYYNASWDSRFEEVFRKMHGYDVQLHAPEIMGEKKVDPEKLGRIKSDYRETISKMHQDYLTTWIGWCNDKGFVARNQSHGAPGNLLDLYGAADIPETEIFGSTPFPIPGLRRDPGEIRTDQDLPELLVNRMASSAAHVMGHPLISSESCTWLRDHWKVALSYAKPELDRVMLDGINHIVYHGTVYSPPDAPWPGWLFYASTQFNPNNTWWDDFSELNGYVERVQSVLQQGRADNDILVYWPIYDIWDDPNGLVQQLTVHSVGFLINEPVGKLARALEHEGYGFDYISDAQLLRTRAEGKTLFTPGNRYSILVVPATERMPVDTLRQIIRLAEGGATVALTDLPRDVPGWGRLEQRRDEFNKLMSRLAFVSGGSPHETRLGKGVVLRGEVSAILKRLRIPREPMSDRGIGYIRRESLSGHDYFFANLTAAALDDWVPLGVPARSATILDPLSGDVGIAALRKNAAGLTEMYVQLEPGQSLIVRTLRDSDARGRPWPYLVPSGPPVPIEATWKIEFVKGGPELPPPIETGTLKSWTELGGEEAQRFGGTARYSVEFDLPSFTAADWLLDLGDVRESARVRINGKAVATAWSLPFKLRAGGFLKPGRNVLELDVTNLAANRIRDMDRRGVQWKIMHEINFVNIRYQPFDASNWELKPSGLLGPIRLIPLRALNPAISAR